MTTGEDGMASTHGTVEIKFDTEELDAYARQVAEAISAEAVAKWLHEHPAEAVEIVRGLRVAGPWRTSEDGERDSRRDPCTGRVLACASKTSSGLGQRMLEFVGCERACEYQSLNEAKAAADAALVAAGWSLA